MCWKYKRESRFHIEYKRKRITGKTPINLLLRFLIEINFNFLC